MIWVQQGAHFARLLTYRVCANEMQDLIDTGKFAF